MGGALAYGADPQEDHAAKPEGEKAKERPTTIVLVQPSKPIDPEVAGEEVLKFLESAKAEWAGGDPEFAEKYFAAALGVPAKVPQKEVVLQTMAELYQTVGQLPKAAAVLERLAREYPDSRRLPYVYLELGFLYRKLGALELSIAKFYDVFNATIHASFDQLDKYKEIALQARLEIAETHALRQEYGEAERLYQAAFRGELKEADRKRIHYRICYLLFELGSFQQTVTQIKLFIDQYPQSPHTPEMRYLLAKSYDKLDRRPEALREVVEILQRQSSPDTANAETADYWKQRTGNELANEFYGSGDFRSALSIYQALVKYSADPQWRWPAIHQIGLCFERLGLPERAKLAYEEIVSPEGGSVPEEKLTASLRALRDIAQWRLEHLDWEDDLMARLQILKTQ